MRLTGIQTGDGWRKETYKVIETLLSVYQHKRSEQIILSIACSEKRESISHIVSEYFNFARSVNRKGNTTMWPDVSTCCCTVKQALRDPNNGMNTCQIGI